MSGDAPGIEPLAGYTIGITAARRREEFGAALERRGATVVYAPAIKIVPLADDSQLRDATERCLAAPLDIVIATTGIGFRGWIDAADTWGLTERLTAAIDRSTVLARGPKARGAIRASGLRETWSPESESSSEVLAYLIASGDLEGKRIAVQLHGEPLPDVVETLRLAGAEVIQVPVYRWVLPEDTVPLRRLIQSVGVAGLDAVAFTSAPAAASFLRAADEQGCGGAVRAALRGSVVAACVGPVTACLSSATASRWFSRPAADWAPWSGRSSNRSLTAADGGCRWPGTRWTCAGTPPWWTAAWFRSAARAWPCCGS